METKLLIIRSCSSLQPVPLQGNLGHPSMIPVFHINNIPLISYMHNHDYICNV